MMDHTGLKESNSIVDLEIGDEIQDGKKGKKKLGRFRSGSLSLTGASSRNGDHRLCSGVEFSSSDESLETLVGEDAAASSVVMKEKRKKRSCNKPPRPPKGPSLNMADMKLVRELSDEFAKLKHARIEQRNALKKKRGDKESTWRWSSNIVAMLITILFFYVIIFQGSSGSRVRQ